MKPIFSTNVLNAIMYVTALQHFEASVKENAVVIKDSLKAPDCLIPLRRLKELLTSQKKLARDEQHQEHHYSAETMTLEHLALYKLKVIELYHRRVLACPSHNSTTLSLSKAWCLSAIVCIFFVVLICITSEELRCHDAESAVTL